MLESSNSRQDSLHRHLHPANEAGAHQLAAQHPAGSHPNKYVEHAVGKIEQILHHNPHDFSHVYNEVENLRKQDPKHFNKDLDLVNKRLHADKYLPKLELIQDDHIGKQNKVEHGYDVAAKDASLKHQPGNHTIVSTSHHEPKESAALRHAYHKMRHGNLWNRSVEGHHGADGGYDSKAVGGKVPTGARKDLIDKALELAGVPVNASTEAAVNKIVSRESGWNPNITNNWDSNARAGHPSTGLMQTIPGTFHQYALPGYNGNIHDPLSNLVAGIRYAQARYARGGRSGVEVVASRPGGY